MAALSALLRRAEALVARFEDLRAWREMHDAMRLCERLRAMGAR